MRVIARIAIAVACASALFAPVRAAGTIVFTTIDVPGAVLTNAQGINLQGDIVGGYNDAAGVQHGYLLSGVRFRLIDFPGARSTLARRINAGGAIRAPSVRPAERT